MKAKLLDTWQMIQSSNLRSSPTFRWRDAGLTRAVKLGSTVLIEDFDAPLASVSERLNSILETTRTLMYRMSLLLHLITVLPSFSFLNLCLVESFL